MPSFASAGQDLLVEQPVLALDEPCARARHLAEDLAAASGRRAPRPAAPSLICSFRPETRISKNSSRLEETMQRKRRRSSSGTALVLGLREHAAVELERLQLAVEEMLGAWRDTRLACRCLVFLAMRLCALRDDRVTGRDGILPPDGIQHPRRGRPRLQQLPPRHRPRGRRPDLPARLAEGNGAPGRGPHAPTSASTTERRSARWRRCGASPSGSRACRAERCAWSAPTRCAWRRMPAQFLRKAETTLGFPDRGDLRARGGAPHLPRRGALAAAGRATTGSWSTSAAARPSSSSATR